MESFNYPMLLYENAQSLYTRLEKQSIPVVTSSRKIKVLKYNIMSSQQFIYHWITKCASSTRTALTLPLNLTSFSRFFTEVSSTKHSACPNSNLHASILAFVVPINPASGQCCLNITAL